MERSENDIAVKIVNLKKRYRLGVIGGGTLQGDIQSWWARRRGKEDPNSVLGTKMRGKNETFLALDGINLTIYKGEKVGIIGHNGAGKSTLLKVFSRITAPTEGRIYVDGRVSSMLEVGTGFHEELTGRENIYLNGAILGMSRAEVDEKIEQIIEFSECRQFIDTPVKRYSSGMYVKLAFSVSAHLDADILVMDEVLAVGDIKFQHKCLSKMSEVSSAEGKTILYVSHNMNTIRQLCDRCVVLDHGRLVFDGDVEEAIAIYSQIQKKDKSPYMNLIDAPRYRSVEKGRFVTFESIEFLNKEENLFKKGEIATVKVILSSEKKLTDAKIRFGYYDTYGRKIASGICTDIGTVEKGENEINMDVDFTGLVAGTYRGELILFTLDKIRGVIEHDIVLEGFWFDVDYESEFRWNSFKWGAVRLHDMIKK